MKSLLAALYFIAIATVAALIGQHVVRRLIVVLGRASIIIFILASTIFVSAISLGKKLSPLPSNYFFLDFSSNCSTRALEQAG